MKKLKKNENNRNEKQFLICCLFCITRQHGQHSHFNIKQQIVAARTGHHLAISIHNGYRYFAYCVNKQLLNSQLFDWFFATVQIHGEFDWLALNASSSLHFD